MDTRYFSEPEHGTESELQPIGTTTIISAGRITSRDPTKVVSYVLDYEGARFLAQALAIATGGNVHVTYVSGDGEHSFHTHPDHWPNIGPGSIDRSFLLPR